MSRVEPNDNPAAWERSLRKQAGMSAEYADLEVQPIRWAVEEIDRLRAIIAGCAVSLNELCDQLGLPRP